MEGEISLRKAEETIGKPVFWQLPNDSKAMIGSRNAGVPLIQHAPRSKVQQSLTGMAAALSNKDGKSDEGGGQSAQPASSATRKRSFFGFK